MPIIRPKIRFASSSTFLRQKSNICQTANFSSKELTNEELKTIDKLPFFDQKRLGTIKRSPTTKRQAYLDEKLSAVKLLFNENTQYPGFINHSLPLTMRIPFEAAQGTDEEIVSNRLSVTKLLTKSWCELRHAYDVYAKVPMFEGRTILKGKEEHQRLEDQTHSFAEEKRAFEEDFEVLIPQDDFHKLAESWFASLVKIINIFTDGEAREVLCHGYLNKKNCELVEGPVNEKEDVLISGVIDHLILKLRDLPVSSNVLPIRLENTVVSKNCDDVALIIEQLHEASPNLLNQLEIVIGDVKTRFMRKIPNQQSVLNASKLQVMYYRYFLGLLGQNPKDTYEKLLINAQRRGFDINRFIDPAKMLSMMAADDSIRSDMYRLKNGDSIGFEPFDQSDLDISESTVYDMSDYHDMITDARVIEKYSEFFEPWAKPVTLKYFAARLAQMYHHLAPLLSDKLMIEYYYNGDNFHNILFEFDLETLKTNCLDSSRFWFGKRDIEPISMNPKNFLTFCKYCDYESVCSWKRRGIDVCKELGSNLAKINGI